jgi:hypothetical protein
LSEFLVGGSFFENLGQQNTMNDSLVPNGAVASLRYSSPSLLNVNLQKIDNGFIIAYWDKTGNHQFHCANLGLVKDQLESLFDTN